jgi:hypothetical protein
MNKRDYLIFGVSLTAVLFLPSLAHAAFGTLIPSACNCDTPLTANGVTAPSSAPAWGCVFATLQNALTMAVQLATVLISIFLALAGFTYMTSGGSAEKRQLANKRLVNAVIGLLIVLGAYLLVDSLMKVIYNAGATDGTTSFGPWNAILVSDGTQDCLAPTKPPKSLAALTGAEAGSNASGGSGSAGTSAVTATGQTGLNISAAVSHLDSAAIASPGNGQCAQWVRQALNAGGFSDSGHPTYAKDYGSFLTGKGFSDIGGSDSSPQAGDVVVIQNYPGGSVPGHIAMYDGSQWVSDFVQQDFWGGPGYRKYQPSHEFYRP